MPDIIVMSDTWQCLTQIFLDLWMSISYYDIHRQAAVLEKVDAPAQAFLLHVGAAVNLVAL